MDERILAVDEADGADLGRIVERVREIVDERALRMSPPVPSNWPACDGLGEARHGPPCGLEQDPVSLDEGHSLFRAHETPIRAMRLSYASAPTTRFGAPKRLARATLCFERVTTCSPKGLVHRRWQGSLVHEGWAGDP